ncbi:MAG: putative Ig domain-containing protein, partial [Longimicrobiales bacterium]
AAVLPANATLTNGTRTFSATLKTSGARTLTATDTASSALTDTANITVNPVLAVSDLSRTRWTVNRPGFDGTMTISGGTGPFNIQTSSGIPTGLTPVINGNTISFTGTSTTVGNFPSGSITIQDSAGASIVKTFGIQINSAPTLGALSQTQWTVNHPGYSGSIAISNGTDPFSNLVVNGLPAGLSAAINGTSINITGTPTATGTFNLSVSVTDVAGATATQNYSLVINPAITITPSTLPNSTAGTPYSQTVTANGGTGNKTVTYSVTGTLPAGLNITPLSPATNSFTIAGTPTGGGSATINVTATDSVGASTTTTLNLTGNGGTLPAGRPRWDRG